SEDAGGLAGRGVGRDVAAGIHVHVGVGVGMDPGGVGVGGIRVDVAAGNDAHAGVLGIGVDAGGAGVVAGGGDGTGAVDDGIAVGGVGGDTRSLAIARVHVDVAVAVHVGVTGGVREDAGGVAVVRTCVDGGAGVVDADIAGIGMRVDAGGVVEEGV